MKKPSETIHHGAVGCLSAALLCSSVSLAFSSTAWAQDAPLSKPQMIQDMHTYFHGEKWEGPVFFGAGLAAAAAGTILITRDDEIARGAAYPVYGIGLIQLIVGAVVYFRTDAQVAKLDKQLETDPAGFKRDESARIAKVNREFVALAVTELGLIAAGTATAAIGAQQNCCRTLQGVGLGFAAQGAVMLMLDLFATARARRYTRSLDLFEPTGAATTMLGPVSYSFRF